MAASSVLVKSDALGNTSGFSMMILFTYPIEAQHFLALVPFHLWAVILPKKIGTSGGEWTPYDENSYRIEIPHSATYKQENIAWWNKRWNERTTMKTWEMPSPLDWRWILLHWIRMFSVNVFGIDIETSLKHRLKSFQRFVRQVEKGPPIEITYLTHLYTLPAREHRQPHLLAGYSLQSEMDEKRSLLFRFPEESLTKVPFHAGLFAVLRHFDNVRFELLLDCDRKPRKNPPERSNEICLPFMYCLNPISDFRSAYGPCYFPGVKATALKTPDTQKYLWSEQEMIDELKPDAGGLDVASIVGDYLTIAKWNRKEKMYWSKASSFLSEIRLVLRLLQPSSLPVVTYISNLKLIRIVEFLESRKMQLTRAPILPSKRVALTEILDWGKGFQN